MSLGPGAKKGVGKKNKVENAVINPIGSTPYINVASRIRQANRQVKIQIKFKHRSNQLRRKTRLTKTKITTHFQNKTISVQETFT